MSDEQLRFCVCMGLEDLPPTDRESAEGTRAALLDETKWPLGTAIPVRFLEGSTALQERVKRFAEEWVAQGMANLSFNWVAQGDADIRIAFRQGAGSWSYLGTVCKRFTDQSLPTMNYGWLTDASSDADVRSVVLHEFGHALGLIHEHQNPKGGIKWNEPAVKADLSGPPNNWTFEQIYFNVLKPYLLSAVVASPVDANSIMMYPIPAAWTLDGFNTGFNGELSQTDRDIIRAAYP